MVIEVSRASLKYLHSIAYEKHPSRTVMNFRHLLGCDTIVIEVDRGYIYTCIIDVNHLPTKYNN